MCLYACVFSFPRYRCWSDVDTSIMTVPSCRFHPDSTKKKRNRWMWKIGLRHFIRARTVLSRQEVVSRRRTREETTDLLVLFRFLSLSLSVFLFLFSRSVARSLCLLCTCCYFFGLDIFIVFTWHSIRVKLFELSAVNLGVFLRASEWLAVALFLLDSFLSSTDDYSVQPSHPSHRMSIN